MEEVDFRAYWREEKRLCKVHSLHFGTKKAMLTYVHEFDTRAIRPEGQGSEHEISRGVVSVPFDKITLEPWTGLRDKNGKKIYAGDLVMDPEADRRPREVRWDEDCYGWRPFLWGCGCCQKVGWLDPNKTIVVGNIHEGEK